MSCDKPLGWQDGTSFEWMDVFWGGSDPVHLTSTGYREMAVRLMETGLSRVPSTHYKDHASLTAPAADPPSGQEAIALEKA